MLDYHRWKHRIVRDLAWVIASPPLISGQLNGVDWWGADFLNEEYLACLPALEQLDHDPAILAQYLASMKSKALGHRFEALVAFWLKISPRFELIDKNLQIQGEGRTLGELDFIIRDRQSDALIHLEVSVKFYMGVGDLKDLACWYGSNLNDSFGKKVEHLKQHQTQLTHRYPQKIKYSVDQRCCCMKGRLFYPEQVFDTEPMKASNNLGIGQPDISPTSVIEPHLFGIWGNDLKRFLHPFPDVKYFPIQKQDWLSDFTMVDQALVEVMQSDSPARPQCFVLSRQGKELVRYFQFPAGYFDAVTGN